MHKVGRLNPSGKVSAPKMAFDEAPPDKWQIHNISATQGVKTTQVHKGVKGSRSHMALSGESSTILAS